MHDRWISQWKLQDACERIDPETKDLNLSCQILIDKEFTLAEALVRIADEQSNMRKPVGSAPVAESTSGWRNSLPTCSKSSL